VGGRVFPQQTSGRHSVECGCFGRRGHLVDRMPIVALRGQSGVYTVALLGSEHHPKKTRFGGRLGSLTYRGTYISVGTNEEYVVDM